MSADPTVVKKFSCQHRRCFRSFKTEKELRKHKVTADDHEYCEKCNEDFEDWESLVKHRKMTPEHIACRVCGEEFRSSGGRDRHYNQAHLSDQNIACPGCSQIFARAGGLIAHLEKGQCRALKKEEFNKHLQHTNAIRTALQSREGFGHVPQSHIEDEDDGGVRLFGPLKESDQPQLLDAPLHPLATSKEFDALAISQSNRGSKPSSGSKGPDPSAFHISPSHTSVKHPGGQAPGQKNLDQWPLLGSKQQNVGMPRNDDSPLARQMGKLAVKHNLSSSGDEAGEDRTPRTWARLAAPAVAPGLSKDLTAQPTSPQPISAATSSDRNPYQVSKTIEAQSADDLLSLNEGNMFRYHQWDPNAKDFDVHKFYQASIDKYSCPFPSCEKTFENDSAIRVHLSSDAHALTGRVNCPSCLREFKSTTALIQHCESASTRCRVKKLRDYGQLVHEMSGGFLNATPAVELRTDDAGREKEVELSGRWDYEAEAPRGFEAMKQVGAGARDSAPSTWW